MKRILVVLLLIIKISFAYNITIIGDSLSIGASRYYKQINPDIYIDAKAGRQFKEIKYIILRLERNNKLADTIIIELGTNGDFSIDNALYWIDYLIQKKKRVVLVTVKTNKPWQITVNKKIQLIKEYRPDIIVADWFTYSKDKSYLFSRDGTHLTNKGYEEYAKFILSQIR